MKRKKYYYKKKINLCEKILREKDVNPLYQVLNSARSSFHPFEGKTSSIYNFIFPQEHLNC